MIGHFTPQETHSVSNKKIITHLFYNNSLFPGFKFCFYLCSLIEQILKGSV